MRRCMFHDIFFTGTGAGEVETGGLIQKAGEGSRAWPVAPAEVRKASWLPMTGNCFICERQKHYTLGAAVTTILNHADRHALPPELSGIV